MPGHYLNNGRRLVPRQRDLRTLWKNIFVWIWMNRCISIMGIRKEGQLMSDFEILMVVFTVLGIVVTLIIEIIKNTKK